MKLIFLSAIFFLLFSVRSFAQTDTIILTAIDTQIVTSCTGIIVDDGGFAGNYSNNAHSGVIISNASALFFRVRFSSFATDSSPLSDQVKIYNGTSTTAQLVGSYTGLNLPNNGNWITVSSNQFLLSFYSDISGNYPGFVIEYQCVTNLPAIDFISSDTLSCDNTVTFFNNTYAPGGTYLWDFGDGTTSTAFNPDHTYASAGIYTVSLACCNAVGCDTLTKLNYIQCGSTSADCDVLAVPNAGTVWTYKCSGTITDNGGLTGLYTNYVHGGIVVTSAIGNYFRMRLTTLKLALLGLDYVKLYNGPNALSPLIGGWSPTPPQSWLYTTSNQFYLLFNSDAADVDSGFVLEYECMNGVPVADFHVADTPICGATCTFVNTSLLPPVGTTSYIWDFGDGYASSDVNPFHTYAAPGVYTVTLIACNNFGCDTLVRTNYINYDTTQQYCIYFPLPPTGTKYVNKCTGYLVDDGGLNGSYSDSSSGICWVTNSSNVPFRLRFTSFDVDASDYVRVYDDPLIGYNILGTYNGNSLPLNGGWLYSVSNKFGVQLFSDSAANAAGFEIEYECLDGPLFADFYSTDTNTCGNTVVLKNMTGPQNGNVYYWLFGDGGNSTQDDPIHVYSQPGNYTITLVACNAAGCDTMVKTNYIHYDTLMQACQVVPVPVTGITYVNKCSGIITDNGGLNGNYVESTYGKVILTTTIGNIYAVRFTSFNLAYFDHVNLYDNISSNLILIGHYNGSVLPDSGDWIYADGNELYVEFYAEDNVNNHSGFEMEYKCLPDGVNVGGVKALNNLRAFPNPAKDVLVIEGEIAAANNFSYTLTNTIGQQVLGQFEIPVVNGEIAERLDLKNIAEGLYFLNLVTDNEKFTRKIIVNKQ